MRRHTVRRIRTIAIAGLLAAGLARVDAQRPERQQEVRIPGTNIMLRAGWQLLFRDACRFSVPASWRDDGSGSLVLAPDGSSLSLRSLHVSSWSAYKAQLKSAYGTPKATRDDSDHRLWLEIGEAPLVQHHISVAEGLNVCSALLTVRTRSATDSPDVIKQIADSIGSIPEGLQAR